MTHLGKLSDESVTGVTPVKIDMTGVTGDVQIADVSPVPIMCSSWC